MRVTLKAGVFAIILDGFDEYILWNKGKVKAAEVLLALGELAKETGAGIVITSRTSFWESSLSESEPGVIEQANAKEFVLEPFDHQHARDYFSTRLEGERPFLAMAVFEKLREFDKDFIGRGFVLSLIADFAERSEDDSGATVRRGVESTPTLDWLLRSLCEREELRQQLPLDAAEQLRVFRSLALEAVRGHALETASVEVAMSEVQPALDGQELADTVAKIKQHPLIRWRAADDKWTWQEEQIEVMLLADYLCQIAPREHDRLVDFCEHAKLHASRRNDIAAAVVGVALTGRRMADDELAGMVRELVSTTAVRGGPCRSREGCGLGVAIALRAVDKAIRQGGSREERRRKLEYYCGDEPFRGLLVTGTVAAMDFRGVVFHQCYFDQVVWARCRLDGSTVFDRCRFVGGEAFNCQGFGLASFGNAELDPDARAWIGSMQVADGKKKYSESDLKADMKAVLNRFGGKGGVGLKRVARRSFARGTFRSSPQCERILEELMGVVLEEHGIGIGTAATRYGIRKETTHAVRFYLDNNVFIGPVQRAYESLLGRLNL